MAAYEGHIFGVVVRKSAIVTHISLLSYTSAARQWSQPDVCVFLSEYRLGSLKNYHFRSKCFNQWNCYLCINDVVCDTPLRYQCYAVDTLWRAQGAHVRRGGPKIGNRDTHITYYYYYYHRTCRRLNSEVSLTRDSDVCILSEYRLGAAAGFYVSINRAAERRDVAEKVVVPTAANDKSPPNRTLVILLRQQCKRKIHVGYTIILTMFYNIILFPRPFAKTYVDRKTIQVTLTQPNDDLALKTLSCCRVRSSVENWSTFDLIKLTPRLDVIVFRKFDENGIFIGQKKKKKIRTFFVSFFLVFISKTPGISSVRCKMTSMPCPTNSLIR